MVGSEPIQIILSDRIYVRVPTSCVELFLELTREFEHKNPQRFMKEKLGLPVYDEPRVIVTWERIEEPDGKHEVLAFPRGGMKRVRAAFARAGMRYEMEDRRSDGVDVPPLTHRRSLYVHQAAALDVIIERENCLLRSPTGSGKTTIAIAAIARAQVAALIIVPNRKLFDLWLGRVSDELGIKKSDIGQIRGGKFSLRPVTVGIQKSVANKASEIAEEDYFGMIIADEVSLFAAKTFMAAVDPLPARYRIGVSDDHRRKDRKEFLIHDIFGEVAMHIKHEDLIVSGHVLDVEVRIVPTEFRADWYGAAKGSDDVCDYDRTRLLSEMQNDGARNRLVLKCSREMLAQGHQMIVLCEFREHCMTIDQALSGMGTKTGLLLGGNDDAMEFTRVAKGLADGSTQCGVGTYKSLTYGIDIPRLGCALCATPIAGNEQVFKQARGRICRTSTGKSGAIMIYLWDRFVFPDHVANIARWNANTVVLHNNSWVPAKTWMKTNKAA